MRFDPKSKSDEPDTLTIRPLAPKLRGAVEAVDNVSYYASTCDTRFPSFRCRSCVALSPLPLPLPLRIFIAVYGCNGTEFSYVTFAELTTEFYNGRTAKRQRKNGNGMVETGHKTAYVTNE